MKKNITMRLLSAILMMAMLMTCVPAGVIMASAAAPDHYISISTDSAALVDIDGAYEAQYFEFVPTVSGRYQFFSSTNSGDPRVELLDAYGDTLASDDDSGGNANFDLYYYCEANTTYYVKAYMFGSGTGYYTLNVRAIELNCDHNYVVISDAPASCTNNGVTVYACSLCNHSYSETTAFLGHDYVDGICTVCGAELASVDIWNGTIDTSWYGEDATDFIITTAEELAGLAYLVNSGNSFSGKTVYLANSIDLDHISWTPIGNTKTLAFSGTFDGQGHVIYNLNIQGEKTDAGIGSGFFGTIKDATVRSLGLEDASVVVRGGRNGILCGILNSNSLIENCYTIGSISIIESCSGGGFGIGGFVGDMQGGSVTIRNCYSAGEVLSEISHSSLFIGGFVGFVCGSHEQYGATKYIENCYSANTVTASNTVKGGFIGELYHGDIYVDNCFDNSTVNGTYNNAVVGNRNGQHNSSRYYLNNVYYNSLGYSTYGGTATYAENFSSYDWLSSTLGWDFGTVWGFSNNYDYPVLQGFAGGGYTPHTHEYAEVFRTDATCTSEGVITYACVECGRTYSETISIIDHSYVVESETPADCVDNGVSTFVCVMCGHNLEEITEHAYGHDYADGVCTRCGEAEPAADEWDGSVDTSWYNDNEYEFIIYTAEELAGLAYLVNNGITFSEKTIYLGSNIDLKDIEWTPIGRGTEYGNQRVVVFSGRFDGMFHTISGLYITGTSSSHVGLFGSVDNATIENLAIDNAYISVEQTAYYGCSSGILVGYVNRSTVSNISVSGEVTVNNYNSIACTALAIGYVYSGGTTTVTNVSARGTVYGYCGNSNSYVGGIVGVKDYSEGQLTVENCIFVGTVTASDRNSQSYAGGIVGISCGGERINHCVFIGEIYSDNTRDAIIDYFRATNYSNCYYNANFTSTRGTATDLSSFNSLEWIQYNLGWDFSSTWCFTNSVDYPMLQGFAEGGYVPHIHEYEEASRIDATCMNEGVITYACIECERTYTETLPIISHDYVLQSTTVADCENDGVEIYACSMCGVIYETTIESAYGHSYENGYCVHCGEHIFADAVVIGPGENAYVEITERYGYVYFLFTPAQSGRYQFYSSNNSGDTYGTLYDGSGNQLTYNDDGGSGNNFSIYYDCEANTTYFIKAHMYGSGTGYYTFYVATIEIYCDHEYAEVSRTDATCTSEGIINYTCTLCDATSSEIIPMLNHVYLVQSTTSATCTSNGIATYACSACGHNYEEIVERAYGHDFVDEVCTRCGADEPEADLWDGSIDTSWYNNDEYEFIIYTAEELAGLAYLVNSGFTFSEKTIYLGADIDLANIEWTPIGVDFWIRDFSQYVPSCTFSGVFDGCNHTIYNLSNSAGYSSFAGLFGTTYYATIQNVELANVDITLVGGSYRAKVGALIGYARSTVVQNCGVFNANLVVDASSNPSSVGGLIGITYTCTIENSFAYADVAGNGHIGGLIGGDYSGSNSTTIHNCYAVGSLTSTNRLNSNVSKCMAGILAYGYGYISDCVYIGEINDTNSFEKDGITDDASLSNCYYSILNYDENFLPEDFMSYDWVVSNLYWDFDEIWEFNDSFDYPVLQGFIEGGYTPHDHEYVETSRIEPTCVNEGVITYTCTSCGRTYNETIVAPGHEFVLQSTTEADCVNNGVHVYTCTRCQESYEEVHTYAYGHSFENGYCVTCGEHIFADAIVVTPGDSMYVSTTDFVYFQFTPTQSGRYNFYSTDYSGDPRAWLVDGNGNELIYDDDSGSSWNFSIYYDCTANQTYYIKAYNYSGYYTFNVETIEIYCDHDYIVESSTAADCVNDGITTYVCSLCGNVYSEVTEWAFGHDYILQGTTEADCENNGVSTYACTRCDSSYEEIHTYANGHSFENGYCVTCGEHIFADAIVVTPGDSLYIDTVGYVYFRFTPTQSGRYNFYSTDYSGDPRAWLIDEAGNELAYDDDSGYSWNFSIYFDCEANQTYYIKVGNSGSYYTFNVDTVEIYCDHDYVIESSTTADCVNDGTVTYVCSLCGNTYVETVEPAHGHDYILQSATAADCVNSGMEAFTCSRCNDSYEMIIRPIGHHYENGVCIRCGAEGSGNVLVIMDSEPWGNGSITRMLNSLVSDNKIEYWNSVATYDVTAEMLRSYGVVYIANAQGSTSQTQIKAMKGMLEEYVSNGGILIFGFLTMSSTYEYGNTLPGGVTTHYELASNNYIVDATHPIITGALSDNFVLTNEYMFGSSASHDYIDADTLPEGSRIIVTDTYGRPTLAEYNIGSGTVIATGMTWEFYWHNQYGNFGQYAYDDLILYAVSIANGWTAPDPDNTHTPSGWIVDTEATCTTPGSRHIECIDCGAILTIEEIPVTAHTYGEWSTIVEATCTTAGAKRAYCTLCENAYIESYIPATGHTYSSELIRAATCTTPGIMAYTCAKCNDSYQVYIYSEHQYVHSTRIEPTCTEDGADVYVCTRCEDSYTVVIAGGHDYVAEIITVATPTTAGEMKYTCSKCGDFYTEEIPARPYAEILLVQDRLPWSENNNVALLDAMMASGYIGGWDITTTAGFGSVDMSRFNVILIANDQTTATYDQLSFLQDSLVEFARAGGVVIYGACDNGWAGGNISYTLPEGVEKNNYYSHHNYIVDASHPIVLGSMTDGKPLTNDLLYGNYCSHTAFNMNTLPDGANIILQDGQGNPTLVEYAVGDGHIILSGLTWEFYYTREAYDYRLNTTYTRNVYDDLIVYAASLSNGCDHAWDDGVVIDPTCTERGYTLHTCALCDRTMKENYTAALGHALGDWEIELPATAEAEGLKVKRCTLCGETLVTEVLPIINAAVITVESLTNSVIWGDEITFTVVISGADPVKSMALTPIFDTNYFELVSVSWVIQAFVSDIEEGTLRSVAAWRAPVDINTTVYSITLRAKALTDSTTIDFTAILSDEEEGTIIASVVGKTVSIVECSHTEGSYVHMNAEYHAYICDHCGYTEMQAHVYDDEHDTDCNVCGHARYLLGDVNSDGVVDSDDSVYLLYHLFFFEESGEYPVNQVCDFNGDGVTDSDDALYLLYHVLYAYTGDYPLHDAG